MLAGVLALAGCAELRLPRLTPGTTETEVRSGIGAPAAERRLPDGTEAWYYPFGFSGFTTYRVRFDSVGRMRDVSQLLTGEGFGHHVFPGESTMDQILDDFGPPGQVNRFPNLNQVVWTYRWRDVTLEMLADLSFDASSRKVVSYATYRDPAFVSGQSR